MTDTTEWLGKMPRDLRPLTDEWALGAMTPRYQEDGTVLRTLTPPGKSDWSPWWSAAGLAFIVLIGAVFTYPLWR